MHFVFTNTILVFSLHGVHAFTAMKTPLSVAFKSQSQMTEFRHFASPEAEQAKDDEIERLRSMAAQLRAEASALEAEQSQAKAAAAERAFQQFDSNRDGEISLLELKEGLEKELKEALSERRVRQLMESFDKSGDGALQLNEFVGVDKFRNKLEALARDERAAAIEKKKQAKLEEDVAQVLQSQLERINDKEPTATDKLVSILPYLFPLLDGFQYARFLVLENQDNPFAVLATLVYTLYRSVPFGGFIAFFALNFFAGKPGLNRLVRYNMQQAIFLDIALFFPGLFSALISLTGLPIPADFAALTSDAIFFSLLLTVGYAMASSLFGVVPNKIPFVSEAVDARVPTADTVMNNSEEFFSKLNIDVGRKETKEDDADGSSAEK